MEMAEVKRCRMEKVTVEEERRGEAH